MSDSIVREIREAAGRASISTVRDPNMPVDIQPLFDVATSSFGRFLLTDPEPRAMLIPEVLPCGTAGLVAATGGVGKSVLVFQLGVSISTGIPFLGMPIDQVGGVLMLMAEDDEAELHRRGRRILDHAEASGAKVDRGALSDRLHVVSRVAQDNMLTAGREGEVARTALVDRLITAANQIPDLKLIVIDPASRSKGGNANNEADATRFVEVLEAIRAETGATVLSTCHTNKASLRDRGDADQSVVRGSTALVDGVRWVATMTHLRRDAAADYDIPADDASRYVRLDLVKTNYTRPWPGMWLRREAGGVLVPTTIEAKADARREAKADARYSETICRVQDLLRSDGPMPARAILALAGSSGILGAGGQHIRSVIRRAVDTGDLSEAGTRTGAGGGTLLDAPPEAA